MDAGQAALEAAQSQLSVAQAKLSHDQSLFDYSKITAPFAGSRHSALRESGNAGAGGNRFEHAGHADCTLVAGRSVPPGDSGSGIVCALHSHRRPGDVRVPSLNRTFPGKVARFSVDVHGRHAHHAHRSGRGESKRVLLPGLYAEAELHAGRDKRIFRRSRSGAESRRRKDNGLCRESEREAGRSYGQVGIETSSDAEIVSGLNEGEQVVVSDRSGLKAGRKSSSQQLPVMRVSRRKCAIKKQIGEAEQPAEVNWIGLCQDFQFAIRISLS